MSKRLAVLLLAVLWSQTLFGETRWCSGIFEIDPADKKATLEIDWRTTESCTYDNGDGRIDERMGVAVWVHHFNFLHYGLKFDIEEETIEAYAELASFWSKFFGLDISTILRRVTAEPVTPVGCSLDVLIDDPSTLPGCFGPNFDLTALRWRKLLREGQEQLAASLKAHTSVELTADQIGAIAGFRKRHEGAIAILEAFKKKAFDQIVSNLELNLYDRVEGVHKQVLDAYQQFDQRAELVENGQKHTIKKKKPGTLVTVKMSASRLDGSVVTDAPARNGADRAPTKKKTEVAVAYFVHSRYPLLFHAGPTYTDGIDDSDFKTIRQTSGEDLFAKVTDDQEDLDLTAFLSWEFLDFGGKRDMGLMVTFGTEFEEPGKRLYGGLSVRWKRWILTVGQSRAEVVEGESMETKEEPTDPDLFRVLRKGTDEGTFYSVSFNVFGIK